MTSDNLAFSTAATKRVFPPGTREQEVCSFVFDRLELLRGQFDSLTLGSVATALGWLGDSDGQTAIARALDYLAFGDVQILERRFVLWPAAVGEAVLEEPICELSDAEVRRALEEKVLIVPTTGEPVHGFMEQVGVVYSVTPFAHNLVSTPGVSA